MRTSHARLAMLDVHVIRWSSLYKDQCKDYVNKLYSERINFTATEASNLASGPPRVMCRLGCAVSDRS